jgi:hypothetical protein
MQEEGGERMLVYYESNATVLTYLCQECAELALHETEVTDLIPAAN